MRAQDLMVGDFVRVKHIDKIGKIYRIDAANGAGNEYAALLDGDFDCKDLEPIPLTPEILEKNGWSRPKGAYYYVLEDNPNFAYIAVNLSERTRIFVASDLLFNMAIGNVHELQHALKLCEIEKEIVL